MYHGYVVPISLIVVNSFNIKRLNPYLLLINFVVLLKGLRGIFFLDITLWVASEVIAYFNLP